MHKHHHCECNHADVRFCKKCQRPYCVDCGQEWYAQSWHYSYPYSYTLTDASTVTYPQTSDPIKPTITCSHTAEAS